MSSETVDKSCFQHRLKILVACEESQRVCIEFRNKGHEAYSCDIIECSGGHPEWHIMEDVLPLLNGNCEFRTVDGALHKVSGKWDMIIAFPPCTHLAVSGAAWFEKKREDGRQKDGIEFFCKFIEADCNNIVIENPIGIISGDYIPKWFPELADKYDLPKSPHKLFIRGCLVIITPKVHACGSKDCHNLFLWLQSNQNWNGLNGLMGKLGRKNDNQNGLQTHGIYHQKKEQK